MIIGGLIETKEKMVGMMDTMMASMMNSMSPDEKQDSMIKLMPEMMKQIKGSDMMDLIREKMVGSMFVSYTSKHGFSETIQAIKKAGDDYGWYNPVITNHYEIEESMGLDSPNQVATVSMCIPRSAYHIIKENPKLAVMMPMQITVYEDENGVHVVWMNITMMGKMFGSNVSKIMGEASKMILNVLEDILDKKEG